MSLVSHIKTNFGIWRSLNVLVKCLVYYKKMNVCPQVILRCWIKDVALIIFSLSAFPFVSFSQDKTNLARGDVWSGK